MRGIGWGSCIALVAVLAGCSSSTTGTGSSSGSSGTSGSSGSSGDTGSSGSSGSSGGLGTPPGTPPSGGGDCMTPVAPEALSGGCAPRLVTPAACEVVDLTAGKAYEFAWTTDGTGCETPWQFQLAGNPPTADNTYGVKISENPNAGVSKTGGILNVNAADIMGTGVKSSDGTYTWLVQSFYGSHPASNTFKIKF